MKVYKYLFSVIVMLGLISCSSEESDFENDVVSTVGQYTVAFNLSNDITTKAADDEIAPDDDEAKINEFVLFICDSENGHIIQRGYFKGNKGNTCTFNFKPIAGQDTYYAYAVANAGELSNVSEYATVADLKNATASILQIQPTPNDHPEIVVSALPKMGVKPFTITPANISKVQDMGVIPVYQLVSKLQLQVRVNFEGDSSNAEFLLTNIKWSNFSKQGKIGGDNTDTNGSLFDESANYCYRIFSEEFVNCGDPLYTFPNVSNDAILFIQGSVMQNGSPVGSDINFNLPLGNQTFVANTKYNVQVTVNAKVNTQTNVSFNYNIIEAESITVKVPDFE